MRDNYDGKTAVQRVAERRQRLIDAGFKLFGEHGYAGTSIRAVMRQSGLRDRYFGESFADLDQLLAAVYRQLVDEELASCRAAIDATDGSSHGARAMIETLTRSLNGNPSRGRIKLREVLAGGPACKQAREESLYKLAALVADLLPPVPSRRRQDRLLLGLSIVAAADELLRAWLEGQQYVTSKTVADVVMSLFDSIADGLVSIAPA